jgi:hypothetical protein
MPHGIDVRKNAFDRLAVSSVLDPLEMFFRYRRPDGRLVKGGRED